MERKIHLAHGNSTGHVSAVVRHGNGQRREHPGYSNPSRIVVCLSRWPLRLGLFVYAHSGTAGNGRATRGELPAARPYIFDTQIGTFSGLGVTLSTPHR